MKLWNRALRSWKLLMVLPLMDQKLREHESRIQELERELDLSSDPSEFGNKLQRRRNLEYLRDVPLDRDEQKQWEAGL